VGGACPSAGELDRLARGEPVADAVRVHAERCAGCAEAVAEIRENERFLGGGARTILAAAKDGAGARAALARDAVRGFELIEEISRGGQGVVYRAVQASTKRPAAIKVLLGGAFASDRQRHRFEREVEIAARLRHPNIVSVFESGLTTDGTPYVAMEFVEGVALDAYVEQRFGGLKRWDRERINGVVALMAMVASGAGHAHSSGVMHRDLKPSNILVDREGRPRVLDFGLARASEPSRDVSTTREFVGTPAYASPEQLGGDPASVNARADVFALGLILYNLLTGRHPYPADGTLAELARHAIGTEPTPPSRIVKRLPSDVETIVLKCLAKDPQRRYANAAALASDLEDYLEGRAISARRDSAVYVLHRLAMRHRIPAIAMAVVLLTVVGAAVGLAILAGDLDSARRDAERALADSDVQRARLVARTGNAEQAERVIWERAIASAIDTGPDLLIRGTGAALRDGWALAEIYASSACVLRVPADRTFWQVGFTSDDLGFWAIDMTGSRWTWTLDGKLIERTPSMFEPLDQNLNSMTTMDGDFVYVFRKGEVAEVRLGPTSTYRRIAGISDSGYAITRPTSASPVISLVGRGGNSAGELLIADRFGEDRIIKIAANAYTAEWDEDKDGLVLLVGGLATLDTRIDFRRPPDWRVTRSVGLPMQMQWTRDTGFRHPSLSADGSMLLCGAGDGIYLLDLTKPDTPLIASRKLLGPLGSQLRFLESGEEILAVLMDGSALILSTPDLAVIRSIFCGTGVRTHGFSERLGAVVASYNPSGVGIHLFSDRPWLERIPTPANIPTTTCIDIGSDGTIAWGDDSGSVTILPQGDRARARSFQVHGSSVEGNPAVNSVRFSRDGSAVVTAGMDGAVREHSLDGRLLREIAGAGPNPAWSARYAPDGSAIAAGFFGGTASIWREGVPDPITVVVPRANRVPQVAFSPDGTRLVCGAASGAAPIVIDTRTGETVGVLSGPEHSTRTVAWSADGAWIITGRDDASIGIWDARTHKLLRSITGLPFAPFDLRLHPQGNLLFAVGRGGDLMVLDPVAGTELARLRIGDRSGFGLAVSPDGKRVAFCGQYDYVGLIGIDRLAAPIRGNEAWWRAALARESGPGVSHGADGADGGE
jgi:hypothetical protein